VSKNTKLTKVYIDNNPLTYLKLIEPWYVLDITMPSDLKLDKVKGYFTNK